METKKQSQEYSLPTGLLACVCLTGNGCFVVAVLALHLLQPELSPLYYAVSYYVHGAQGWLFTAGLLLWGIGSAALLLGLLRATRIRNRFRIGDAGLLALAVWSAGILATGLFSADPPGQWDKPLSTTALVHENAARVSFIALPIAAFLLSHGLRRAPDWRQIAGVLYLFAVLILVSLIVFFVSLFPLSDTFSPPILFGLTERMLLAAYAAWLCAAAIGLLRSPANQPAL
jgi:Protein of unknown function (DUF998)